MGTYILYRISLFVPTLLVLALAVFLLSKLAPGDPVTMMYPTDALPDATADDRFLRNLENYRNRAISLGLDKAVFYVGISNQVLQGRDQNYVHPERKQCFQALSWQTGSADLSSAFYDSTLAILKRIELFPDSSRTNLSPNKRALQQLVFTSDLTLIESNLNKIISENSKFGTIPEGLDRDLKNLYKQGDKIRNARPDVWKWFFPCISWNGSNNQFHNWLKGIFVGDLGFSYRDRRAVGPVLYSALRWTLLVNGLAILLALLLSVPLGVYSAVHSGKAIDNVIHLILLFLYAIPVFWTATILLVFFTTPEYGEWSDIFPSMGVGYVQPGDSIWSKIGTRAYHLFLPVICLGYPALAFLTRQMRATMRRTLGQDFIRQARALGISRPRIIWNMAFRNALFPMITLLGSLIPAVVTGSVVIEVIFAIPGTGKLLIDSIFARDWPMVYAIVLVIGVVTVLAYLLVDILYRILDPRIRTKWGGS